MTPFLLIFNLGLDCSGRYSLFCYIVDTVNYVFFWKAFIFKPLNELIYQLFHLKFFLHFYHLPDQFLKLPPSTSDISIIHLYKCIYWHNAQTCISVLLAIYYTCIIVLFSKLLYNQNHKKCRFLYTCTSVKYGGEIYLWVKEQSLRLN